MRPRKNAIRLTPKLRRKRANLPAYVVIEEGDLQGWDLQETTVVEGTANGWSFGRRSVKPWARESDRWFLEFTAAFCGTAGLEPGDIVDLEIRIADTFTPPELAEIGSQDKRLNAAWMIWSNAERRMACEHVRAGRARATRERRASSILAGLRSADKK